MCMCVFVYGVVFPKECDDLHQKLCSAVWLQEAPARFKKKYSQVLFKKKIENRN